MDTLKSGFASMRVSVWLPAGLLALGVAIVGMQLGLPVPGARAGGITVETVTLSPANFTYRDAGHFLRDGDPVDAPLVEDRLAGDLVIMKFQVTSSNYDACVTSGACEPAGPRHVAEGEVPATGVSFEDAETYAAWFSDQTGQHWSLPSDREWAFAAGKDFADDALAIEGSADPSVRWLASYRTQAARASIADPLPRPAGSFGVNENGVADMGGNVWEWTSTCHRRVHVDGNGTVLSEVPACGIRVLDGRHRAAMNVFVQDAKSGGCSVGLPPDNLGFRLVREPDWYGSLWSLVGRWYD